MYPQMTPKKKELNPFDNIPTVAQALTVDYKISSRLSFDLLSDASSKVHANERRQPSLRMDLIVDLFEANDVTAEVQFTKKYIHGVKMQIYRKGKVKDVTVFLDQNFPTLLWVATKSKAFLVDLTYIELSVSDVEFQITSGCEQYFIMRYFEEQIPFVFANEEEKRRSFQQFSGFHNFHKLKQLYPPYFSKLIKHYTATETTEGISRTREVSQILRTIEKITGEESQINTEIIKQILNARPEKYEGNFGDAVLTVAQVIDCMKITSCNENLKAIFENYAGESMKSRLEYTKPIMDVKKFKLFLEQQQKQSHKVVDDWMKDVSGPLSFYTFCTHLISKKWNYLAMIPEPNRNFPLTDYFIYSSHNTYLSGNQLTSDSKVERYIQDLNDGVKCMEIDVHDGGDVPIVTHAMKGFYLNTAVTFEDVIKEISRFCRKNEGFDPIILSVQNHASTQNRYRMVDIIFRYLHKYLFTIEGQNQLRSYSLAQLKNKVIVKTSSNIKTILDMRRKVYREERQQIKFDIPHAPRQFPRNFFTNRYSEFESRTKKMQERKQKYINQFPLKHYMGVADQMARVTGMFKTAKGIQEQSSSAVQVTSVTNQKLLKLNRTECQRYCRRSFLRVYPVATELASGNYDPIPGLARGAQMIALNTQTRDQWAWLMMSYFTAGTERTLTRMGYLQKPIWLRTNFARQKIMKKIQISVLSDLFSVNIKFYGTDEDVNKNKNSKYCFTIRDYCQAFFMFQVGSWSDCIPVRYIRQGYRVITGRNSAYRDCGVRVLLKVKIKTIPSQ